MLGAIEWIGQGIQKRDLVGRPIDASEADLIVILNGKHSFTGIVLDGEVLFLDYGSFMSFRVSSGNLGFWKDARFLKHHDEIDKDALTSYFRENGDNPYGVANAVNAIMNQEPLESLTQFPPLHAPLLRGDAWTQAVGVLVKKASPGDVVFSSRPNEAISSAIRWFDKGQFSHVAPYVGDGTVADMGPSGLTVNALEGYGEGSRVALYGLPEGTTEEQRQRIVGYVQETAEAGAEYGYLQLLCVFLRRRFRLPLAKELPSVSDLLCANTLRLVHFV